METGRVESPVEEIRLRQQAHYWQAHHSRAVERERVWKEKALRLELVVGQQESVIGELKAQVEALTAKVAFLQQQVFGQKSEETKTSASSSREDGDDTWSDFSSAEGRKRGKQAGAQGHGRRRHANLPSQEVSHDLPENQRSCPKCHLPLKSRSDTEDSEEIDWEVRLVRRVHKRKRYERTCRCEGIPRIVTAPVSPKLIPKGKFSTQFWVRVLLEKYLFQRPLYRTLKMLELEGLRLSQGTLTGGLKRIGELIQPLYAAILEHSRNANHWHMDETRWRVFEEVKGKKGYRWWLWIVATHDTRAFLLDPSRSGQVPQDFLGEEREGVISADRYSGYKTLLSDLLKIAYCWVHVRRDFVRIDNGYARLRGWATSWVHRIDALFHRNTKRIALQSNAEAFYVQDKALRTEMEAMARVRDKELADEKLHPAARKALESLKNHWEGLSIFVDRPEIPMDNNLSERGLRNPVVGRKNYYGSGSIWSGMFTAMMFTLVQTLLVNDLSPKEFLLAYLKACAENVGKPPTNPESFLPWNLSPEQKEFWRYPEGPS
jgi:transposase